MRGIERFLVVVAFMMTGLLVFVSASRSLEQETQAPAAKTVQDSGPKKAESSFVANPFCEACHADFDEEELAVKHELFGIGCERCHGESLRHRSDEANITPPEIMYPKEKINPMCMMCHPRDDIDYLADHRPILEAGLSVFESQPSGTNVKKYCTDCHGSKHRMNTRTTRWDKYTGALPKKGN
jgi:hypothetical protein